MARPTNRPARVASLIKEQVIAILSRDLKDPRVGFVTVTGVDVTRDYQHATVFVSVMGEEAEQRETMLALERATGFVRRELGGRLRLRHVPEVVFRHDDTLERGARIEQLLDEWNRNKADAETAGGAADGPGTATVDPTASPEGEPGVMDRIAQVLESGSRFLLTTHLAPDGDSLGSALALVHVLAGMGKSALVVTRDPVPERYRFLPGATEVETRAELPAAAGYAAAFAFECPDVARTGWPDLRERFFVVNIDHHEDNSGFGNVNWVDARSPAVGEMIHRLIRHVQLPITPEIATCIYVALMTDTGSFTYSNTTADSMRLAAAMIDLGADPHRIALNVYDSNRFEKLRLLGSALKDLRQEAEGRIAWLRVSAADVERCAAKMEDLDDIVNYPRSIRGVEVAAIFKELAPERFRLSLRSKGKVDVFRVAKSFGGGGHRNAAGCSIEGTFEVVRDAVIGKLVDALEGEAGDAGDAPD